MTKSSQGTPPGMEVPLKNFFSNRGQKLALKFTECASITYVVRGIAPWNIATWRATRWGW